MDRDMLDRIYKWNTLQLWNETVRLKDELKPEIFDQIKHGFHIPFHIQLLFKHMEGDDRYIEERHKNGKVRIGRKVYDLYEFFDERDERESNMRNLLIEYYTSEENKTEER